MKMLLTAAYYNYRKLEGLILSLASRNSHIDFKSVHFCLHMRLSFFDVFK